jgi:hypothetical protein
MKNAALALLALCVGTTAPSAATLAQTAPTLLDKIILPGAPLTSFDVSWVDAETQTYYLADRSNKGVDIIDAKTNAFLGRVEGFVGQKDSLENSGPNGVLVLPNLKQVWAADGDSTVKVIDIAARPPKIIATFSTGGKFRANVMAYDEDDGLLLVTNGSEETPYVSLISTAPDHKIRAQIKFPNASEGTRAPAWDKVGKHFYLSLPEIDKDHAKGAIAEIDPKTMAVSRLIPVSECQGAGLAFGPDQQLLVGCSGDAIKQGFKPKSLIVDVKSGTVAFTIPEVGGSDQVWYNAGDGRYYLSARDMPGGSVLGVIDAKSGKWIANVPTAKNGHSVAANAANNHIFVPLTPNPDCPNGCVGVYGTAK